jgi:hypothetical protein
VGFIQTGGVAEDGRPGFQPGRRRPPARFEPAKQQLIGRGALRPDGDRRQAPQSGYAKDDVASGLVKWDQDVMRELVLRDQVQAR